MSTTDRMPPHPGTDAGHAPGHAPGATASQPSDPPHPAGPPAPAHPHRSRWLLGAVGVVLLWLLLGGVTGPLSAKLTGVQENDNAAFLPASAEATRVIERQQAFSEEEVFPAVVVYERESGITAADRAAAAEDVAAINELDFVVGQASPPLPSQDGKALQVLVPVDASDGLEIGPDVEELREIVGGPEGLTARVGGLAGIQADFSKVFESIDSTLLLATAAVVVVILLLVYRSPLLPAVVLFAAGLSLVTAQAVVYLAARYADLTVNGQSQGILTVLVFGAGTDYALLLVSRFREELRNEQSRFDAVRIAVRGAAPAIVASGATVVLGLLCLLLSELNSNKSLGPVAAIGIACSMVVMLTFLPAVLALGGRALYWPFRPRYGSPHLDEVGIWGRIAGLVGRRARLAWIATAVVLVALALGTLQLKAEGISQTEAFSRTVESIEAQEILSAHFPGGAGSPAQVVGRQERAQELLEVVRGVEGVADATFLTEAPQGPPQPGAPAPQPRVAGGFVQIDATLQDEADGPEATRTVQELRRVVDRVEGADALVGGLTAVNIDVQEASQRDRVLIIPVVLAVIFVVLAVLLRAIVAPLLLIATVVLSFAATLGVCALVFNNVFGFAGADSSFPLFSFVFLVALGIDYNIFLMTRVREETVKHGTRRGVLKGLAVTGGVITSAGVVLASTFAVLGVLPLVFLAELGFAVAFGVLLDTLLVRSVLVPALTYDLGRLVWWPSRLARAEE